MPTVNITHGDDVDGLTCGALISNIFKAEIVPANYDDLEQALQGISKETNKLFITDLNLREALLPLLKEIREHSVITMIDHHPMEPHLKAKLNELGIELIHDTRDCAAVLVYDKYRNQIQLDAARLAAYAAVSDMFEDGPIAHKILDSMDRKFVHHEALLLSHALGCDQSIIFKRRVIEGLAKFEYPHRIQGVVKASITYLDKVVETKGFVSRKSIRIGNLAYMEFEDDLSTGEVANIIMDTLLVPVGMCWKDQGEMINISLRGERGLSIHLGELAMTLSKKHGGFGGGHARASGAKIPTNNLKAFISDLASTINASLT